MATRKTEPTESRRRPSAQERLALYALLRQAYPDAHCELDHRSAFELLVATVLSAQTTDVAVNKITPELFSRWPTPAALAQASTSEVEVVIGSIGMFRQKAQRIVTLSALLLERHQGQVPNRLDALVQLPGVGRKTANVVLGEVFGTAEGVVVDTHVARLAQRLGWTTHTTPEEIEQDLMAAFPQGDWPLLAHTLIWHGRRVCGARAPACVGCPVSALCPSAHRAEDVGRKAPRARPPTAPNQAARAPKTAAEQPASRRKVTAKAVVKPRVARDAATAPSRARRRAETT